MHAVACLDKRSGLVELSHVPLVFVLRHCDNIIVRSIVSIANTQHRKRMPFEYINRWHYAIVHELCAAGLE